MMSRLCCFLRFWFRRLSGPPDLNPSTDQPHVSCQNIRITTVIHAVFKLAATLNDNTTLHACCVIPVLMCCRKVEEHRTTLSQMLNMADPNPSVTLMLSSISWPTLSLPRSAHPHFSLITDSAVDWIKLCLYNINPKPQILKALKNRGWYHPLVCLA